MASRGDSKKVSLDRAILFELFITPGESLHLGEFAAVDLEKARRFFEVRFWGAVTAAKYAAKRNQIDRIDHPDQWYHRVGTAKRMGHRSGNLRRYRIVFDGGRTLV